MSSDAHVCGVCGAGRIAGRFMLREMYYGSRDTFEYLECADCGCLQIAAVPDNLQDYYRDYYSLHREIRTGTSRLERWFRRGRLRRALGRSRNPLWGLVERVAPKAPAQWLQRAKVDVDARVLDVGSGRGDRLQALYRQGFGNLHGVDPFIDTDLHYPNGVMVRRCTLAEVQGEYDLVMAHHSLEHMPDQHGAMAALRRLLAPGGCLLIRIPVKSGAAWRHYGEHWVQLDAPRHLFLHTEQSLLRLAAAHGLEVVDSFYDSTDFQFIGSELYRRDIPLIEGDVEALFPAPERAEFRRRARELNQGRDGDQACFVLRPSRQRADQPAESVRHSQVTGGKGA